MNLVQPIRDKEVLKEMRQYFKEQSERNYLMFLLGIHTGLRISDILALKVKDVQGWEIFIKEKKTGKLREIKMTSELKRVARAYTQGKPRHEYLIKSREGKNKPISRSMAYKILNQAAEEFGLERIGTHSLRKTYGYHHYKKFNDIVTLQEALNHDEMNVTKRYIGIKQDELNKQQTKIDW